MLVKDVLATTGRCYEGVNTNEFWANEETLRNQNQENTKYEFPCLSKSYFHQNYTRTSISNSSITWSSDGTSICVTSDDFGVRQFLVPEKRTETWGVFTRWFSNASIVSSLVHPSYSLFEADRRAQTILCGSKDLPIRLYSLESVARNETSIFSYSTINQENEQYETPYSMTYLSDSQFVTGSVRNRISIYDLERHNPIWQQQWTRESCGNCFQKAIISCFDESNELRDVLRYAGTYKGELFAFDMRMKSLRMIQKREPSDSWSTGIYQVIRSDNGHFLYCFKRGAKDIDVLDVRKSCNKINTLKLPFNTRKQKFKASMNVSHGLLLGSFQGKILNWDKNCVEFGGLDPLQLNGEGLAPTNIIEMEGKERINCISSSATEPDIIAISSCSDKFGDGPFKASIELLDLE